MLQKVLVTLIALTQVALADTTRTTIDPQSSKVNWMGSKEFVGDSHKGTVSLKEGFLIMDGDKITGGEMTIDMTSIQNTDLNDPGMKEKLVGHLKSPDFFDVATYKDARFVITKVTAKSAKDYIFEGNLTIRGKTNPIAVPATLTKEGKTWVSTGKVEIDRTKFDVKYNSKTFVPDLVKSAKDKVIKNNIALDFTIKTKI